VAGEDRSPLAAVEAHLAAFNARDADAVAATFASDATFVAGEQLVIGRAALRAMFADAFAAPIRAHLALRHAVVEGDVAACELVETLSTPGGSHELDVAAFYAARDGRLTRARVYRDLGEPT